MDKNYIFTEHTNVTHGRGYVYLLQYHIVWVTKYRKPVLVGMVAAETKRHLLETMEQLQMECLAMEVMPDHIHLLVNCKLERKCCKMAVYGASRPEEIPLGQAFVEPILFCGNCQRTEHSTDRSVY